MKVFQSMLVRCPTTTRLNPYVILLPYNPAPPEWATHLKPIWGLYGVVYLRGLREYLPYDEMPRRNLRSVYESIRQYLNC